MISLGALVNIALLDIRVYGSVHTWEPELLR